jgi:hypothetical protein
MEIQMKKVFSSLILGSLILVHSAHAESNQNTPDLLTELPDFPATFKGSLKCDLLGPVMEFPDDPDASPRDKNSAYCLPDANGYITAITPINGEVNYGLIERIEAVGFDTKQWRIFLADIDNLKRFEVEGADSLHFVIEIATSGVESWNQDGNYFSGTSETRALEMLANFSDGPGGLEKTPFFIYFGQGFIERRKAEAKTEDRAELIGIWKRIMSEQIKRYLNLHG